METTHSEQIAIDGNKDPSVKESLFYMVFLLTIYDHGPCERLFRSAASE